MASANGNALPANCGKSAPEFHSLHREKGWLWTATGDSRVALEDQDEEDDDQNDHQHSA
jgi:hypothetical protein